MDNIVAAKMLVEHKYSAAFPRLYKRWVRCVNLV